MYYKILLVFLVLSSAAGAVVFLNLDDILDQSSEPVKADLIVCIAGGAARAERAVSLLKQGYGKKIVANELNIELLE